MNRALAHYETRSSQDGPTPKQAARPRLWVQADLAVQIIAQITPGEAIRSFTSYPGRRLRPGAAFDLQA
ncbi:MAG: hypothetical protein K2P95_00860 [Hyphomonadaceae bacterium]|nr:hypothetical protein [Hyphomonadaceae bacterium]